MCLGLENPFIGLKMGCMQFLFSKLDACWLMKHLEGFRLLDKEKISGQKLYNTANQNISVINS